ncbi:MAG TPA: putative aminohydrolase SsnA [Anaerolineae bacterium]|nr:putative aminohydrolase SsnA [Anaerolineae bacterium]HOR00664.1 putative aminohydrolase SsnA [Anaerolineae bacterium]HPL28813.1 putative aminohydrolase SsnA [Anaerolineae bacterium]
MLITHATLVRWMPEPAIVPDTALCLQDGRIAAIGPSAELAARYPAEPRLDAAGLWLLPGLVCAHTHIYSAFARGMATPGEPPADFMAILRQLWWRLDRALGYDDIRCSALLVAADAIRHGVTTLFDHHASPTAIRFSLDVLAEALEQAGLRASLCYEVTDRGGPEEAEAGIAENVRFVERARARGGLLRGTMGLHASLTLSDATMRRVAEAERSLNCGYHVHVAEGEGEVRQSLQEHGVRVVERWSRLGVLGPRTIAAHCIHVDAEELAILADSRTRIVHNPRSNMNNGVGAADVPAMLRRHLPVGLGNDGFSQNMFQELQLADLLPRLVHRDPLATSGPEIVDLLLRHNPETASAAFGLPLGQIEIGAAADVILLRYAPPTPVTAGNLAWHILFGLDGSEVDTTIVAGRVLMRHGELQTLDAAANAAKGRELAAALWKRL